MTAARVGEPSACTFRTSGIAAMESPFAPRSGGVWPGTLPALKFR